MSFYLGRVRLNVSVHVRMSVRGRMVDGPKVDMQFTCLPAVLAAVVMAMVEVGVVTMGVVVAVQIDPGEF